jgi:hypothetical protein
MMNRILLMGLFACTAAMMLFRQAASSRRAVVPVEQAAEKLREAWADHHTTA